MEMEIITKHEDRIIRDERARKRRKSIKNLRELRQHRFYAKQKRKRNKI
jgi:hypothetical protein